MSTLTKTLVAVFAAMLVGGAAYVAAAPSNNSAAIMPASADVKGPCDEPEHATDPRCAGAQVPEDNQQNEVGDDDNAANDDPAEDVNDDNGVDDPAEDVNDDNPGEVEDHGNRGPGSPNSGPGNARDRGEQPAPQVDNSGPGSEDSGQSDSGHSGSGESGSGDDSGHSGSDDSGSGGSGPG